MKRLIIFAVIVGLMAPTAMAGYSPGWNTGEPVEVFSGVESEQQLLVVSNYEDTNDQVQINVRGNLSEVVEPETEQVTLAPNGQNGDRQQVTLTVTGQIDVGERINGSIELVHTPENAGTSNASGATASSVENVNLDLVGEQPPASLTPGLFSLPFIGSVTPSMIFLFIIVMAGLALAAGGIWTYRYDEEEE